MWEPDIISFSVSGLGRGRGVGARRTTFTLELRTQPGAVGKKISSLHLKCSFLLHSNPLSFCLNQGMFCVIMSGSYSVTFFQRMASHVSFTWHATSAELLFCLCSMKWKVKVSEPNKASKGGAGVHVGGWTRDRSGVPGNCVLLSASVCFCIFSCGEDNERLSVTTRRGIALVQALNMWECYASGCQSLSFTFWHVQCLGQMLCNGKIQMAFTGKKKTKPKKQWCHISLLTYWKLKSPSDSGFPQWECCNLKLFTVLCVIEDLLKTFFPTLTEWGNHWLEMDVIPCW